tara:strand:- start:7136 stop:8518 length:1383 start_codon:yes stop_codon:yes gene_type:complete
MNEFEKLGLSEKFLKVIDEAGFEEPSEIQEKAIPLALEGKDVIGKSATGSGKTLAFGASIIEKAEKGAGVQSLILTPTRELAEQVSTALRRFSKHFSLRIQEVYGGVGISGQISGINRAEIVVGTPGRVLDHLERGTLKLDGLKTLVLDEADRMVDMGFLPDVERIFSACPDKKQILLFSATMTQDITYIEKKYTHDAKFITVESYVDPTKLKQIYYDVDGRVKFSLLVHLLKKDKSDLVMVFCNTRRNVDLIVKNLQRYDLKAMAIHGGLTQEKRNRTLQKFHDGQARILVCTDVAARGLDIKNVSHVYNYDIPKNSNEYIHRIGRTARAGNEGEAISLVSSRDYENYRAVLRDDSLKIKEEPVPEVEMLRPDFGGSGDRDRGRSGGYGGRGNSSGRSGGRSGSYGGRSSGRSSSGSGYGNRSGGSSYGNKSGGRGSSQSRRSDGRRDDRGKRVHKVRH